MIANLDFHDEQQEIDVITHGYIQLFPISDDDNRQRFEEKIADEHRTCDNKTNHVVM